MPLKITIDRNLIIAVQKREQDSAAVLQIFNAHNHGRLVVGIPASNRVENQLDGADIQPLEKFLEECSAAGLKSPEVIDYPLDWEMGLWEHSIISNEAYDLESKIHEILHPAVPAFLSMNQPANIRRKVINRKCDVFALWGHIWFGRDVFLTKDKRSFQRKTLLEKLGARGILQPREFMRTLAQS